MDRATYSTYSNRVSTLMTLNARYRTHVNRIHDIMNRQPGTSKTLDNKPPIVNSKLVNIKYQTMRDEFNDKAARENKALLKRIGKILTAPPTIAETNVYVSRKPGKAAKELAKEKMNIEYQNKILSNRLNKVSGHYRVKDWENDYQRQLQTQRFVRQVFYRPPKPVPFIDPKIGIIRNHHDSPSLLPSISQKSQSSDNNKLSSTNTATFTSSSSSSLNKKASTNSQVGRMRIIKDQPSVQKANSDNHISNNRKQYKDIYSVIEQGVGNDPMDIAEGLGEEEEEEEEEEEYEIEYDDSRKELASIERFIKVSYDSVSKSRRASRKSSILSEGDISCWLVDHQLVLIIATVNNSSSTTTQSKITEQQQQSVEEVRTIETEQQISNASPNVNTATEQKSIESSYIQAEADILLSDLASVKGYTRDELLSNQMDLLLKLAKNIVDTVEIRIDTSSNEARLLLSLLPGPIEETSTTTTATMISPGQQTIELSPQPSFDPTLFQNEEEERKEKKRESKRKSSLIKEEEEKNRVPPAVSQDDLAKMVTDTSTILEISKIVKVPILLEDHVESSPKFLKRSNQHDFVQVNVNASIIGEEDVVCVKATVLESSELRHNYNNDHHAVINKDKDYYVSIGLPSIAHADAEMMLEYLYNVVDCCVIHYDDMTGESNLKIPV